MKKTVKKVIAKPQTSATELYIVAEIPVKAVIAETSTDFQSEAMVGLANKVNEIIRYLNK